MYNEQELGLVKTAMKDSNEPEYTKTKISLNYRPLNCFEIGSLVPSLARSRF